MLCREYNRKISIYNRVFGTDEYGGLVETVVFVRDIWAKINTSAGTKFTDFGIQDFKNPVIFSVRGIKNAIDYNENHYIRYKGVSYFIKGIQNKSFENMEYDLYCDGK